MTEDKDDIKKEKNGSEETDPPLFIKRTRRRVYEEPISPDAKEKDTAKKDDNENISEEEKEAFIAKQEIIVRNNVILTIGAGTIPLPIFDAVSIVSIQVKMIRELARHYNIPFSEQAAKSFIASLIATATPLELSSVILGSFAKNIPGVGSVLGASILPTLAGTSTFALGKTFIYHFEKGGTFDNLDAGELKGKYEEMKKKGKNVVAKL